MDPSTLDVGPALDLEALVAQVKTLVGTEPDDPATGGALRAALADQADFNRSLVEVIGLLAARVRDLEGKVAALERRADGRVAGAVNGTHKG